jgi:hypothetical protein
MSRSESIREDQKGERPAYNARAKQSADSDYMTTIGACWEFRDREKEGFVVKLSFIPAPDSKGFYTFILVPPKRD